jgi:hypothetical protein
MNFINSTISLIKQGKNTLNEYGLAVFIKRLFILCIATLFRYQKTVIYENDGLSQPPDTSGVKLQNIELLVISSSSQLVRLFQDGYKSSFYFNINAEREWLNNGALLFGAFLDKEMVHKSWVAASRESAQKLTPYIKTIGYSDEVMIDSSATNPRFFNKGIYQYVYAAIFYYAHNLGRNKVRFSSPENNAITQHVQKKLGSKIIYTGYRARILYFWEYWSLRPV